MYDLIFRGATLVDGSGAPPYTGDLAIEGDRIVAVGVVEGDAKRVVDAEGLLLTPGWVDMHTHYDGQITWDPYLTPSGWHGVTTVVMGNCGVGFAPCRESQRDWLIQVMEGVEDIPGTALHTGIKWGWETFPEYLDFIESIPHAIDFATQVPHSALRAYVMGERSAETDAASPEEIAQMARLTEEALRAGALGFSTSRTPLHKSAEGIMVAGTHASREELFGIAQALKNAGGVFECASDHVQMSSEIEWMKDLARETGQPVVFNLSQVDQRPDLWRSLLKVLEEAAEEGLPVYGQCAGRSIGIVMHLRGTAHPFVPYPTWQAIAGKPWPEQLAIMQTPAFREALLADTPVSIGPFEDFITQSFNKMFVLRDGDDYEPAENESLAALAAAQGTTPQALAFDTLIQHDGDATLYFPLFNYSNFSLEPLRELHAHPRTLMGLSDGGAHCGAICDSGMPTFMLTHWTRDRKRGDTLPLEYIVMRQTSQTAQFYGINDRGLLKPGYRADVNLIDYDALSLDRPQMVFDLPAEGRRLIQRAHGYRMTVCAGQIIVENDTPTGAMPGKLIRGAQPAPS